ncbi:MAG TPA: DNA cytosine methyltransferase [Cyclobacteriaceae bacterium]|nr:DNA cytosine methyltransferase [Cyclobacteriaceae bacterium]HMV10960.1 DNA cytosine methyltransferase [Cyclobacteriaceae bacterium]HMV89144.1 DNA cytosine methyltransferase [Cyclobacteriaceae bacterium]HMX00021.1 DNA cytosine methyltransferase [Cyclobacteriaceae bacterium]HMX49117.1 DNA cytosine methyltransferase [Cyclobacteriaceae bacterium]
MKRVKEPIYIDLFAGCGGLSLGLSRAGWKGLFAIEKSKDAFLTLEHNLINGRDHFSWPSWLPKTNHDIKTVLKLYKPYLESLRGEVDLITGGPPCQGFSTAGRRKESDARNGLVNSYLKFIELIRPKVLFFENVKGFTSKFEKNRSRGIVYSTYVETKLGELGYNVQGAMVDFSRFGVPQKRTRFILVGVRNDIYQNAIEKSPLEFFSLLENQKTTFLAAKGLKPRTTLGEAISDLLCAHGTTPSPDSKKFRAGLYIQPKTAYQEFMRSNNVNVIPDSHRFVNHRDSTVIKFRHIIENSTIKGKSIDQNIRKKFKINKHTVIPLSSIKVSPTLTTLPDDYIHYKEPRILTVREYARIQSFPDTFEFKGKYTTGGDRRTKEVPRYTQVGNAIPPLFGEQTGLALMHLLK